LLIHKYTKMSNIGGFDDMPHCKKQLNSFQYRIEVTTLTMLNLLNLSESRIKRIKRFHGLVCKLEDKKCHSPNLTLSG
jgi:hypothetical protein